MTYPGTECPDCDETFCSPECAEKDDRAFHADWDARRARARANAEKQHAVRAAAANRCIEPGCDEPQEWAGRCYPCVKAYAS